MVSRPRILKNLSAANVWIESELRNIHLERELRPTNGDISGGLRTTLSDGVCYLVRLKGKNSSVHSIGHCVVVDGANDCIIESSEKYLLKMTSKSLR